MNEIPVQEVHCPMALPRAVPVKVAVIIAREAGVRSAPAMPWMPRKTISACAVGATAQRTDAPAKLATPIANTSRLPEDVAERAPDEDQRPERE